MSKRTIQHAKGLINGRFFLATTEHIGKVTKYVVVECIKGKWHRTSVSRDRLAILYRELRANSA